MGKGSGGWAAIAVLMAAALPVSAQMSPEEEQRCVWSCLANSPGGAAGRAYQQCVADICLGEPAAPEPSAAPKAAWRAGAGEGGAWFAGVELPGASLTFLCRRGGPGLLAVAGLGARDDGTAITVDGRGYRLPFVAQNGMLYTAADPGSPILGALRTGGVAQVSSRGGSADFPLAGSGGAIAAALKGCRLPS
jgi:hypothetical protein